MEVPSTIRVKRRREDNPVQALVVNKRPRRRGADGEPADAGLPPQFSPTGAYLVFRLQKTEAKVGELGIRLGVPVVTGSVPERFAAPHNKSTSLSALIVESTPATKRKAAPGSPLGPLAPTGVSVGVPGVTKVLDIAHTPPTPGANQLAVPKTLSTHAHPSGGKINANYLQVPQPRKYHLAQRATHKRGPGPTSIGKRSVGGACSGGATLNHSVVLMEGEEVKTGVGVYREKKRRRERKEELRMRLSRESLREKEKFLTTATVEPPVVQMVHAPRTRKRPNVAPQEKKENEERKKQIVGRVSAYDTSGMDVDVPEVAQKTQPTAGPLGKDTHRHPSRDNIDNDDDKLSAQLQAMVLEYLNDQQGITNLPPTPAPVRKNPFLQTQLRIGGGVGGWEKTDRKPVMDDGSVTATEDESEQSEEEGWVYDVYVREKVDENRKFVGLSGVPITEAGSDAGMEAQIPEITTGDYGVLVISNSDDEEWFYNGSLDDGGKSEEDGLSNDEDSNAEDYHTNDYPDEEDMDSEDSDGFFYSGEERDDKNDYSDEECLRDGEDDSFLGHHPYVLRTIHSPSNTASSNKEDGSDKEGDAPERAYGGVKWALRSSCGAAIRG